MFGKYSIFLFCPSYFISLWFYRYSNFEDPLISILWTIPNNMIKISLWKDYSSLEALPILEFCCQREGLLISLSNTSHTGILISYLVQTTTSAPRGARGVKLTRTNPRINRMVRFCANIQPKINDKKPKNLKKIVKKRLLFGYILNLIQFRLNISAKNAPWYWYLGPLGHFKTPGTPGAWGCLRK